MSKDFIYFIEMVLDDVMLTAWRYELKCNEPTLLNYLKSFKDEDLDLLFPNWQEITEDQRSFLKEDQIDSVMLEYDEGPIKTYLTANYLNPQIRMHFDNWRWHSFLDTTKVAR